MTRSDIHNLLEEHADLCNRPDFIPSDPIRVPHRFEKLQDIEIAGFWACTIAWGLRKTIIKSAMWAMELMEFSPHEFVLHHSAQERKRFAKYYHRTFQPADALYFLEYLQHYYREHESLEEAFAKYLHDEDETVEPALRGFHRDFFSLPSAPARTRKHLPTPERNSACKRINLFLRWMVRRDDRGVDFGLWRRIAPRQLVIPYDTHVQRVALELGLIARKQADWKSALALTRTLRSFDEKDPIRYDFALLHIGLLGGLQSMG